MTDTELAEYLHLTPAEAAIVIPKLPPEQRATYERMKQFEVDWNLHLQGGPRPTGALIDTERSTRRRRSWK
jgi:hypothetical protein